MARNVKILFRHYLPGGGFTTSGQPKQGKTITWGKVDVTSYSASGESLTPNDLGLTTVDSVHFSVIQINGSDVADNVVAGAQWRKTNQTLSIFDNVNTPTEVGAGETVDVGFIAVGDSARDVEALP